MQVQGSGSAFACDAAPEAPAQPAYSVAVRTLCEFAAKRGDLDLRFTPTPSAQEGVQGHRAVAARRGANAADYRPELSLSGSFGALTVRGRADGYDAGQRRLEEVKTFKGDLERLPANHRQLHWAQAKVYGALLCRQFELPALDIALVYFDIASQRETVLSEHCEAQALDEFCSGLCRRYLAWAAQEAAHRRQRDASLAALHFPHATFRAGQRNLAATVFRAARLGRCLMAQAPTGIGKTLGTVFPLLKACPEQALDKVFFLSAKGSGRAVALQAIETLRQAEPGLRLRVLELVAREKACEHPDKACHGESCPLARGFYDRLAAARTAAVAFETLTAEALRDIALAHGICPYYLGQELARWCDVVVGDYNHYFDGSAVLHALSVMNGWRVAVMVDEAHNLVDRARDMYSATLAQSDLRRVRAGAPGVLKQPLARLQRAWNAVTKGQAEPYRVHAEPPARFAAALQNASAAIGELLAQEPSGVSAALLRFYFDALHFTRLLESFGAHSLFDASLGREGAAPRKAGDSVLCVRNVRPAPFLAPRFAAARATVLFSATLTPQHYYADALGLPGDTAWLEVETPFEPAQLQVRVVREISTRWRHRERSLEPIAELMARQYAERPGNYLAFFSSHDYLARAAALFRERHPGIPMWQQTRGMQASERAHFLAQFVPEGQGIGFAVLGGAFAEGIDLPGSRLIGAFIATLGLPQFNPVNEEVRRRIDRSSGAGYEYVYLFPGIRKVVQAAGRVIRAPTDRGSVHLIDDRFARPEVLRLLPSWWRIEPQAPPGRQAL